MALADARMVELAETEFVDGKAASANTTGNLVKSVEGAAPTVANAKDTDAIQRRRTYQADGSFVGGRAAHAAIIHERMEDRSSIFNAAVT